MASFRDELAKLTNPNPIFDDPEDDTGDGICIYVFYKKMISVSYLIALYIVFYCVYVNIREIQGR